MTITLLPDGSERRHIFFDADAHPDIRESLAYLVPMPDLGLGVIFYTWVHALGDDGQGRAGVAGIAFGPALEHPVFEVHDHIGVPDSLGFDEWTVGPARLTLSDDMMHSTISFHGEEIGFEYTWEGINPSFGFGVNRNGCPGWLAWDRTEQSGRVSGEVAVGGATHRIDGFGHRDHSWGMRDWGGATHWKWWNIIAPEGRAIHVMELQAFGQTTLHGYVQKDGVIATALELDSELTFDERFMHTAVQMTILDDADRRTAVTCRAGADLQWPVSPRLSICEAAMHTTVDGVDGVGYIECAWPPEYIAHHRTDGAAPPTRGDLTLDRD